MTALRLATRESALARWQTQFVMAHLRHYHPQLAVEAVGMTTQGDQQLEVSLAKIGGKGLFVKELEQALLDGRADAAVHSLKDVPMSLPEGLTLAVALARDDPRDALVGHGDLAALPPGSRIGTSSLRRQTQLAAHFPQLEFGLLRGNVQTRLQKLDNGEFAAIVLAAAGLKRLGLAHRIAAFLDPTLCLPAVGQGVIAVECRADDAVTLGRLQPLRDDHTCRLIAAERAMNRALNGSCHVPIAGYAVLDRGELWLRGRVGDPDQRQIFHAEARGAPSRAIALGQQVAAALLAQGADAVLQRLRETSP